MVLTAYYTEKRLSVQGKPFFEGVRTESGLTRVSFIVNQRFFGFSLIRK